MACPYEEGFTVAKLWRACTVVSRAFPRCANLSSASSEAQTSNAMEIGKNIVPFYIDFWVGTCLVYIYVCIVKWCWYSILKTYGRILLHKSFFFNPSVVYMLVSRLRLKKTLGAAHGCCRQAVNASGIFTGEKTKQGDGWQLGNDALISVGQRSIFLEPNFCGSYQMYVFWGPLGN